MWQVPWTKTVLTAAAFGVALAAPAAAEDGASPNYVIQQNQNGFDLPGVSLPRGQDEVRASDGTTCSSSVAGTGAYLDVGVIRGARSGSNNDFATYGRVVVPLGRKPKRLDCSKLYELEVERLRMELDLLKMGVGTDGATTSSTVSDASSTEPAQAPAPAPKKAVVRKKKPSRNWANEGWTDVSK